MLVIVCLVQHVSASVATMLWLSATDYLFRKFTNEYENVVETIRSIRYS